MSEKPRLVCSFSWGETSAYMTQRLRSEPELRDRFSDIVVVVANTSREREEALRFGYQCDQHFGFNTVWLEAVVHHGEKKGCTHRVVNFDSATRDGTVFEDVIRKYGIPNPNYIHCTRELKLNPIRSYVETELGWDRGTYHTAVGIRADEIDRMSVVAVENGVFYPLVKIGATKPLINEWWMKQPFRLSLKGYQGNCQGCFKKSFRKLLTLIEEDPSEFDWNRAMEERHGRVISERERETMPESYRRTFYRENKSAADLIDLHAQTWGSFEPAEDDSLTLPQPSLFPVDLDVPGGCGETCEVWADAA